MFWWIPTTIYSGLAILLHENLGAVRKSCLERLASDLDLKTLFEDYPDLTEEDMKACIAYAKEIVEDEEELPVSAEDARHAHI